MSAGCGQTGGARAGGERAAEWSRARVGVARVHHPDLGGDVETYLSALAEVDARFGRTPDPGLDRGPVFVHRDPSLPARLGRAALLGRRSLRRLRDGLPERLRPGRRYIDL